VPPRRLSHRRRGSGHDLAATAVRLSAAPLDQALAGLAGWVAGATGEGSTELCDGFARLAATVYERIDAQPTPGLSAAGHSGAAATAIRVENAGLVIVFWLSPVVFERLQHVVAVSFSGRRIALDLPLLPIARAAAPALPAEASPPPGDAVFFTAFAAHADLPVIEHWWFLEVVGATGLLGRLRFLCPASPSPSAGIAAVLALAEPPPPDPCRLFASVIGPVVDRFRRVRNGHPATAVEQVYGTPPESPLVSVVVALTGRLDLMRHQLARLSNDPEFRVGGAQAELIYVLGQPSEAAAFERLCRNLYDIYGVPFRVLRLDGGSGKAAAVNVGAAVASGDTLLLLAPGVLPRRPRWLVQLHREYRGLERCAVLGCRLLFEDGSIRHAGIGLRRLGEAGNSWTLDRRFKGLPAEFDPHRAAATVSAVSAACLMIDRRLFGTLGGLAEDYLDGGFAGADLCHRAAAHGRIYYTPEIELYRVAAKHAAREVQPTDSPAAAQHDLWRYNEKWRGMLAHLAEGNGGD
jgi:hypothetical protein